MSSDTGAEVVVDADDAGTVTITATFNEPMDQGVLPTFNLQPDMSNYTLEELEEIAGFEAGAIKITGNDAQIEEYNALAPVENSAEYHANKLALYCLLQQYEEI